MAQQSINTPDAHSTGPHNNETAPSGYGDGWKVFVDKVINNFSDHDTSLAAISGGLSAYALTANPLSQFAATTSAQLAGVISDETGSGALVFGTSPTLETPTLNDAALTGTAAVPTQSQGDNSTKPASTAYVDVAVAAAGWTFVPKTSSQTISGSTTLADDDDLQFAMAANTIYAIEFCYFMQDDDTGGFKVSCNGPSSPNDLFGFIGSLSASNNVATYETDFFANFSSAAGTTEVGLHGNIFVSNGANAGTFAMRLAQNSAVGTSTYKAGSWLQYRVVG